VYILEKKSPNAASLSLSVLMILDLDSNCQSISNGYHSNEDDMSPSVLMILNLDSNCQSISNGYHSNEDDMHYACSDIIDVVSWLLNGDTEPADVMTSGREFHSGMVLGEKDF